MRLADFGMRGVRSSATWLGPRLRARARSVREMQRSLRAVPRAGRLIYRGLRGYGELRAGRVAHVVATLHGPMTQEVLRNTIVWQLGIPGRSRIPAPRSIYGHLAIESAADDVQLDRLMSLLCLSGTFDSFDIVFDGPLAAQEMARLLPTTDQVAARVDLGERREVALGAAEMAGLQRAFRPLFDGRRMATSYLKIACPQAFVVALSLAEDDDGFADEVLGKWLPHLQRFRRQSPGVAFCLLNRTMLSQEHDEHAPPAISPVRRLGFGLADAVALAQMADAFVGRLDVFGLAAMGAHRPGVYVDPAIGDRPDARGSVWLVGEAAPEQCLEMLTHIVREQLAQRR